MHLLDLIKMELSLDVRLYSSDVLSTFQFKGGRNCLVQCGIVYIHIQG